MFRLVLGRSIWITIAQNAAAIKVWFDMRL